MAREIFLDVLDADAVVLPRIVALGDIDEDELAFADRTDDVGGAAPLEIPPGSASWSAGWLLAQLVAAWAEERPVIRAPLVVGGPASTLAAGRRPGAADGRHGDAQASTGARSTGWCRTQLDQYWQHSLEFLRIARDAWPNYLGRDRRGSSRRRGAIC